MSNLTEKDRSILKQVAFKASVEVVPDIDEATYFARVKGMAEAFEEILLQLHDEAPISVAPTTVAQAASNVVSMFPGATVEEVAAVAPVAAPVAAVASASGAPAITAESGRDELWQNLIVGQPHGRVNERDWYDNRGNKRNPAGPDFTHKTLKKGDRKVGLWLGGTYPAPAFAVEHFQ